MALRVGLIGLGAMGASHLKRVSAAPGTQLTAVCDSVPERVDALVGQDKGIQRFESGRELIASDNVDAVLIAAGDACHVEYCLAAIKADKPVFCEKPLAETAEGAQSILDAETAAGKKYVQMEFTAISTPGTWR